MTITLQWDAIAANTAAAGYTDITGYEVQYRPPDGAWMEQTHDGLNAEHEFSADVENSRPADYRFRVRAQNTITQSLPNLSNPWSAELIVPGYNSGNTARPPANFAIELLASGNYRLRWDKSPDDDGFTTVVTGYTLRQRAHGSGIETTFVFAGADTRHTTLTAPATVQPGEAYSFSIAVQRLDSRPVEFSAPIVMGTPAAPTVRATDLGGTVRLAWYPGPDNGHGDPMLRWQVTYRQTNQRNAAAVDLPVFGTAVTRSRLVHLEVAGVYKFDVRGVNRWGPGAPGTVHGVTVTAPDPLPPPTAVDTAVPTSAPPTLTLAGPTEVHPGATAEYTLQGSGSWDGMLGVAAGQLPLTYVQQSADTSYPDCDFDTPMAIACVLIPRNAVLESVTTPTNIVRYQTRTEGTQNRMSFTAATELRVRFATSENWIGQSLAVGFQPTVTGMDPTVHWNGETATVAPGRRLVVQIVPTEAPLPPTAVAVRATGPGTYRLEWEAPGNMAAAGIVTYEIRRQVDDGEFVLQQQLPTSQTWSELAELDPNRVYRWYVRSVSSRGTRSIPSETVSWGEPPAPGVLTAAGVHRAIELMWTAAASSTTITVTGYQLERSVDGETDWITVAPDLPASTTAYVDDQFRGGQTRHYRVSSLRGTQIGPPSNLSSATTLGPATWLTPTSPRQLEATTAPSTVTLTWERPVDDGDLSITGYAVQQATDGTTYTDVSPNTGSVDTRFVHRDLGYSETIHYRVAAINSAGRGYYSTALQITTPALVVPPPADLIAEPDYTSITLRWPAVDVPGTATPRGYQVHHFDADAGSWTHLGVAPAEPAPAFTDGSDEAPLQLGTARRYRIRTLNRPQNVSSEWVEITATTLVLNANFDGQPGVGVNDILFLYHTLEHADLLMPTTEPEAELAMLLERTLLTPLVHPFGDAANVGLEPALNQARAVEQVNLNGLGEINAVPGVDPGDALILYYALAFSDVLGHGHWTGFAGVRNRLLAGPSGLTSFTDPAQLQAQLQRARAFLRASNS